MAPINLLDGGQDQGPGFHQIDPHVVLVGLPALFRPRPEAGRFARAEGLDGGGVAGGRVAELMLPVLIVVIRGETLLLYLPATLGQDGLGGLGQAGGRHVALEHLFRGRRHVDHLLPEVIAGPAIATLEIFELLAGRHHLRGRGDRDHLVAFRQHEEGRLEYLLTELGQRGGASLLER